jgi:hypothetical protein
MPEMEMTRLSAEPVEERNPPSIAAGSAPIEYLFGAPDPAPPAGREREPDEIRYERGGTIYALDGPVGVLRQIVIDDDRAEVKALVVRLAEKNESVLVPPDLVDKSVGAALFLNVNSEQFAQGARRSPRFEARMFTGVDLPNVARKIPLAFRGQKQRSLVELGKDCLVTSDVLDPARRESSAPIRQPRWRLFARKGAR